MTRLRLTASLVALAAASAGLPALAAEGGSIRGGEHDGFTRLVLTVDPTTEWSLETVDGRATLRFPGRNLAFDTEGVYDKIPRDRVKAVTVSPDPAGTVVTVDLACPCRVSTSFVGAQYLALDVSDPGADPAPVARDTPEETAPERSVREARAVASAEEALIRQIERAANQGIVRYAEPEKADAGADDEAAKAPGGQVAISGTGSGSGEALGDEDVLAALAGQDQVLATTVYDRDGRKARAGAEVDLSACLDDAVFAVGDWSNGTPLIRQLPLFERELVTEFDTPNPEALRDMARLYIRFGFGLEAEALLAAFPDAPVEDRAVLVDLARAVEGRAVVPDGPLSVPEPCPGSHGLWLALGGGAPVWHDAESFAAVKERFEDLPVDLRVLLAPGFIDRLLAADRVADAQVIYDTAVRAGETADAGLDLAGARIAAAEGRPLDAIRALTTLIEADGHTSVQALTSLLRVVLDAHVPVPDRIITDLRAAALQYRGAQVETELRSLLVEALAQRSDLAASLAAMRSAAADLPPAAPALSTLMVRLLAEADPAKVGEASYGDTALAAMDLLAAAPPDDPARVAVAHRLLALGLPDPALEVAAPAVAAGNEGAMLITAMAELAKGNGEAARAALGPLAGPEAQELRARAFALAGDYGQAVSALTAGGMPSEAARYAWPSGDWSRAGEAAADDPGRRAMANYMSFGAGDAPAPAPAADPAALAPDLAFQEPLPPLERPSLDSARRLLSTGGKIGGFVEGVIADGVIAEEAPADGTPAPKAP